MNDALYIDSYAALLPEGLYSPRGMEPWRADQRRVDDLLRSQVLSEPYPAFGKLSLSDRLAFGAACLLLGSYPKLNSIRTGIVIGAPWGSLSTDIHYMESLVAGFPSPAIFSATLPSSALAEIAIYFGLKGPNRSISEGMFSGFAALELGARTIRCRKADTMVVVVLDVLEHHEALSVLIGGTTDQRSNSAFAFLLTNTKKTGGIGVPFDLLLLPNGSAEESEELDVYLRRLIVMLHNRQSGVLPIGLGGSRGWVSLGGTGGTAESQGRYKDNRCS